MNVTSVVRRHRSLRWIVPAGVAAVASLVATGVFQADAPQQSKNLPRLTPAALLSEVRSAAVTGFSGTIISRVSLGLPELPALGGADGTGATSMAALLSGSHTVQVWYGGLDQQRVALLGAMDETDFFRSGRQVWTWSSAEHTARHAVLPQQSGGSSNAATPSPDVTPSGVTPSGVTPSGVTPSGVTPSALADQAMAALSPSTRVQVRSGAKVADRDAYELILTPRTAGTRVASVRIAVDASTKLPLAVRVYARGAQTPSIDVAFTSVRFSTPAPSTFAFSPPAGATVRPLTLDSGLGRAVSTGTDRVLGSGWTKVVALDTGSPINVAKGQLATALTPVSGSWGSGGVLESSLVSVLVTSKGRVYIGAVDPSALYAAAAAN